MFARLGRLISRRPWLAVVVWVLIAGGGYAMAVLGVHGQSLFDRMTTGAPNVPGSESAAAYDILDEHFAEGESVSLMVTGVDPADPSVASVMGTVNGELAGVDGTGRPLDPYVFPGGAGDPKAQPFVSSKGDGFLVTVQLDTGLGDTQASKATDRVTAILQKVPGELTDATGSAHISGIVSSNDQVVSAIRDQVRADLETGEAVSLPIALLVMVLVFGGFMAAAMPMAGAFASIGTGLGVLLGITYVMDVDSSVVNVVTLIAVGLSIDYGLLIVSRFREELHRAITAEGARATRGRGRRDPTVNDALVQTMRTAGRTVTFSALTIAISVAGLMVFTPEILRSVGAGGLSAVLIAVATAITLVPALLVFTGRRLAKPGVVAKVPGLRRLLTRTADVQSDDGALAHLATRVQRRPWWVVAGTLVVLGVLAYPISGLQMRNSGIELLPTSSPQRQFSDTLTADYSIDQEPAITVVAKTSQADATSWSQQIAEIPGVDQVDPAVTGGPYEKIGVRINSSDIGGPEATDVVRQIRALDPDFEFWVTGQAATQVDFVAALASRVWWAIAVVVVAAFTLLFLMTGSVVIPLKALITNAISLAASLGVLVWVFQDGHLAGLLGFTSAGGIEIYVVAMVLAFAFGLAMDYEVFLLSRVKELYDAGKPNDEAVRVGLQRSGRIITSAAAIIVVVFAGFVFGQLLVIKEVGFALAVAVVIDATLVRLLLVPATMTLLGKYNWWAPKPLRSVYAKLHVTH